MRILQWVALNLMPFLCITFILNCVSLAKKIKKGDENTAKNTILVTIAFTLIMYSLIGVAY